MDDTIHIHYEYTISFIVVFFVFCVFGKKDKLGWVTRHLQ